MQGLQPQELEAFVKGLFAVAWADGEIQPEEQEALRSLLSSPEIPTEVREAAEHWLIEPVLMEAVRWADISLRGRVELYRRALEIVAADGVVQASEKCALAQLSRELELPSEATAALEEGDEIPPELLAD